MSVPLPARVPLFLVLTFRRCWLRSPDACGGPTMGQNGRPHAWCNYTHEQGDDGPAWTTGTKYGPCKRHCLTLTSIDLHTVLWRQLTSITRKLL